MSKVYGYCRTARAEKVAIIKQIELVENYCKAKDIKLSCCFCDDGVSAHDLNRSSFGKLIETLNEGDVVVMKDISRLARDPQKLNTLTAKIREAGAEIEYINYATDKSLEIEAWLRSKLKV